MRPEVKKLIMGAYESVLDIVTLPAEVAEDAACGNDTAELFFSDDPAETAMAKAICMECPVRALCADFWVWRDVTGVFGGMDDAERAQARGGVPAFTVEEVNQAVAYRRDLAALPADVFAQRHGVAQRTYFRYRAEMGLGDAA